MASPAGGLIGEMGDAITTVEPVFVQRPGQVDYTHIRVLRHRASRRYVASAHMIPRSSAIINTDHIG